MEQEIVQDAMTLVRKRAPIIDVQCSVQPAAMPSALASAAPGRSSYGRSGPGVRTAGNGLCLVRGLLPLGR